MPAYRRSEKWGYRKWVKLLDGRRVRISGTPAVNTRAAAEAAERAHIERVLNPHSAEKKEVPTLEAFKVEFMETYVRANNKPSERISKESMFKHHLLPAFGKRALDEIGTRDIERFKAQKLAEKLQPKSVNNLVTCLGKILRYAAETEVIDKLPRMRFVKVLEQPFDFLDADEYARLMAAAKDEPETYPAVLLGGDAGLRVGEIRALQWDDLDLVAGRIVVQRTDYRGYTGSPKGGRVRRVPMTERLRLALKAARHLRGPWVFCDGDGKLWSRGEADTPLRRATRKAGLRKIGWHSLRHTFCSHLAMRGVPVRTIQELAGHASITTTMRYMHLVGGATEEAIRILERPLGQRVGTSSPSSEKAE
jgi:integrase